VREELLRADRGGPVAPADCPLVSSGIAAIARRWGFTNPGRFAETYRDRFGEDPATTKRAALAAQPEAGKASWRVRRAVSYIEQHLDDPLTLDDIAAAAGVLPRRLQQLFREERGESPMACVRAMRAAAERNGAAGNG
jgi:transcriptional regulator GlxA family with amidase domain